MERREFNAAVFARDQHRCVICGLPAVDAHHILDRKLFADGGYALNNGASLCADCHMSAEMTTLSVEEIRAACGITTPHLPAGWDPCLTYDKWGNVIRPDRTRTRGPLFTDDGARRSLAAAGCLYDGTFGWDPH